MAAASNSNPDELAQIVRSIRERVEARYAQPTDIRLPDLMPLLHARDAAEAKVAAIGTVNPRPPGPLNTLIQSIKRLIARVLDWHVREQVEFNRHTMACMEATLEALNEVNRCLAVLNGRIASQDLSELKDIRSHWAEWRAAWEHKLSVNEIQFLRSVAELQAAFQHRATLMEANFRDLVKSEHADHSAAVERAALEVQKRFSSEVEKARIELENVIHSELRMLRQRAGMRARDDSAPGSVPDIDYAWFAEKFRGSEESVKERQRFYMPYFNGRNRVLDLGCGRGEFLELMREAGVPAKGIDLSVESVETCRRKNLDAQVADLFAYLESLPDAFLDGIFSAQVIEHIAPDRIPEMIKLAASKLEKGGLLAIETPNPECLAIFATHFYLDPTHKRPIPHPLLAFYMEEYGLGLIEVHRLSPAMESMPSLASLPEDFRNAFFGGLDYAIFGRKLS